ncbi:hypothetical protein D3C78_1489890 [compost metagenome]
MSCFKNSVTCHIVNVSAWSNTNATYLRCKCIRQIVTIQVQRCDNIKISWTSQHLLQRDIGNSIFYDDFTGILSILLSLISCICTGFFLNTIVLSPSEHFIAKFSFRYFVAPVLEGTFSELHNVTFVH